MSNTEIGLAKTEAAPQPVLRVLFQCPILDKHSWVKTDFEPSWQKQQWWKLQAADKTRHNKLVLFSCTNDVYVKISEL